MKLHWSGLSSPQHSHCIVAHCTEAYHTSRLQFVIDINDGGKWTVVSFKNHHTFCISFFVFFAPHWRNAETTIYDYVFTINNFLPIYIPKMMFLKLRYVGSDEEEAPRQMVIRPPLLRDWRVKWNFFAVIFSSRTWIWMGTEKLFCQLYTQAAPIFTLSQNLLFGRWGVLRSRLDNAPGVSIITV